MLRPFGPATSSRPRSGRCAAPWTCSCYSTCNGAAGASTSWGQHPTIRAQPSWFCLFVANMVFEQDDSNRTMVFKRDGLSYRLFPHLGVHDEGNLGPLFLRCIREYLFFLSGEIDS